MTMKLIDKDTLISEIEKEIKNIYAGREYVGIPSNEENIVRGLQKAEDIIDTLEVKEVDLEKEFSQWWKDERAKDYNVDILYERYSNVSIKLAKYFFELGLKLNQKGE